MNEFVDALERLEIDEAAILTSFHQSPLPLALLLKMAGVGRIAAVSTDFPGTLLDIRCIVDDDVHEVERALTVARALGYELPAGDDGRLAVHEVPALGNDLGIPDGPFVVLHPNIAELERAGRIENGTPARICRVSAPHWLLWVHHRNQSDLSRGR